MLHLQILTGAGLIAAAIMVAAGDILLATWIKQAGGRSDIAARGLFLLGVFLPYFLAGGAIIALAATLWVGRRSGIHWVTRGVLALTGSLIFCAAAYAFIGFRDTIIGSGNVVGALTVQLLIALSGLWLLSRRPAEV